jgi:hypothetical protein
VKQYLFTGDTHNDLDFMENVVARAAELDAELIQCGDWGFLWPNHDQLKELSDMLVNAERTLRFVDGKHDDHPRLQTLRPKYLADGVLIAPRVIYQPRGSILQDEDGTRFLFCGGAPSIDRAHRTEGVSWWPEEVISQADLKRSMLAIAPVHVLVTHDAPAFPPDFSPKGTPHYREQQRLSMKYVDKLIRRHTPLLHVHGHWHCRYERTHTVGTRIEGLDCNKIDPSFLDDSTLLWSRKDES